MTIHPNTPEGTQVAPSRVLYRIIALILASISAVGLSLSAAAQGLGKPVTWPSVQALPIHTRIQIKADDRKKLKCQLEAVTQNGLECVSPTGSQHFEQAQVREITVEGRSQSTLKGAALGLGIGAGIGALAGMAVNKSWSNSIGSTSNHRAAGAGAGIGAAVGLLSGTLVGFSHRHGFYRTIYRRP